MAIYVGILIKIEDENIFKEMCRKFWGNIGWKSGFLKCKYFWVFKRILYKRYYWRFGKVYLNKTSDWTTLRLSAKVSCGSPKNVYVPA